LELRVTDSRAVSGNGGPGSGVERANVLRKSGHEQHARRESGHRRHIAGQQRQVENGFAAEHLTHRRGGSVQQRSLVLNLYAFGGLPDFERHVDGDLLADANLNLRPNRLLEARRFHANRIIAFDELGNGIGSGFV
jgi:hypothetical protein